MINRLELEKYKAQNLCDCDKNALADLRDITVDKGKSVYERTQNFLDQVHNPYLFKVGDIAVKVSYGTGKEFCKAFSDAIATS